MSLPQAKLTWLGSAATFGFWQAVVISLRTVATLGGHDGPGLRMISAPMPSSHQGRRRPDGHHAAVAGARPPGRAPPVVNERPGALRGVRGWRSGMGRACPAAAPARLRPAEAGP